LQELGVDLAAVLVPARSRWREIGRIIAGLVRGDPYVLYLRHNHRLVRAAIRNLIAQEQPDLIYLDHLDPLVYHRILPRTTPRVIDLHNVYSSMVDRVAQEQRFPWTLAYLRREARLLERVERFAACGSAALFAVSQEDARHFARLATTPVHVVPNGVDCRLYAKPSGGKRHGPPLLVYIGAMDWPSNVRAAVSLARVVLPRVRVRNPETRVRIVGRNPTPEVLALADLEGVEVTGAVPDVRTHLGEAHALVVPLESGGGTRLKILEAFAAGLPVVSTPIGCEGLDVEPGVHLLVADRDQLADAVSDVICHPGLARQLAERAQALVRAHYDWGSIGVTTCEIVERILHVEAPLDYMGGESGC
jgi:glycosyltransferase involved in cell wall biosynthesis